MKENITEKIITELKSQVCEKLKPQIEARNRGQEKVDRLQKAMTDYEEKAVDLQGKVKVLNQKITTALGEGRTVSKEKANLRALREEKGEAEDLAREIKETALVDARGVLKIAAQDLKISVQAAVAESRGKYEKQMRQKLLDFMAIYDAWVSAIKALYEEVKPGFIAGTASQVPRVICEPFKRYVEHVGLGIYEETIKRDQEEPGPTVEAKIIEEEGQEAGEQQI